MISVSDRLLLIGSLRWARPALPTTRTWRAKRVVGFRVLDLDRRSGDARRMVDAGATRPLD